MNESHKSSIKSGETATTPDKPNIVVVLADDLGYGDFGYYGNTRHRTPHPDLVRKLCVQMADFERSLKRP